LRSVHFSDATHGWAVGDNGTILATTDGGAHWTAQVSGTTNELKGVGFPDATHGWAVGDSDTIRATTDGGAHWTAQVSPFTNTLLNAVAFPNDTHGWAVDNYGTILATTDGGAHWTTQSSVDLFHLNSVTFTDANHGWAVGGSGGVLVTTDGGAHWTIQKSGTTEDLYSVAFLPDASHGWAVGPAGAILATTDGGAHWTAQSSGTTDYLTSVAFTNASDGWAVGYAGAILATTDGGAHWSAQASGTTNYLFSVAFTDATHGWAVGGFPGPGLILAYGPSTAAYTLTYTAGAGGKITGTSPQTVSAGGSGTAVTAVANSGYHFVNWSDGSTANPRSDTDVKGNVSVTANFAGGAAQATSITIKTSATTTAVGKTPILSGAVTPNGCIGHNMVCYVMKPGSSRWTYSSNRTVYALGGGAAWQYKYTFKKGMTKGVYKFKAVMPPWTGYLTSTSPTTVSIKLK
jgi:photosystem II stability/assembly factor-like uncharacterized protein